MIYVFKNLPYDADKDFVPVLNLARGNGMLLAEGNAPYNSYKEMIAYASQSPMCSTGESGVRRASPMFILFIFSEPSIRQASCS